jgi:LTXXQ motif family protein
MPHTGPAFHSAVHGAAGLAAHSDALANHPAFNRETPGAHALAGNARFAHVASDPRAFAARRNFASNAAFHPFWHPGWHPGWHPFHHVGWLGPLFWPYAYGNLFYYSLWPYDYGSYDPFWVYGYGDIYEGIFSPYLYDDYVQGQGAPQRMATLTQNMTQSCDEEAGEVTGWPIDQIQSALQPNQDQTALLDDLGNAIVKASDVIRSHCPTTVSFTPVGRLDDMQQRLQGMVQAVDIVTPPLGKFYDSLSDEQKARFNDIGANAPGAKPQASNAPPQGAPGNQPAPQAQCDASVMAWPTDQINQAVQPNDAQRAKLDALQSAATSAADTIKAACPTEVPATPPARLAAAGKHLQAMLQAVNTIRPALHDFYDSLSDSQKAHFNTLGKSLFAQTAQSQE